jgi:hypothetical protein
MYVCMYVCVYACTAIITFCKNPIFTLDARYVDHLFFAMYLLEQHFIQIQPSPPKILCVYIHTYILWRDSVSRPKTILLDHGVVHYFIIIFVQKLIKSCYF